MEFGIIFLNSPVCSRNYIGQNLEFLFCVEHVAAGQSVEMLLSTENLAEHQYGEHKGKYLTKRAGLLINLDLNQPEAMSK